MSRLTERLKEQSQKTGIKQVQIAEELKITPQAVNNLFRGGATSSTHWREIASMLQIPEEEMRALMIEAARESGKTTRLPGSLAEASRIFDAAPEAGNGFLSADRPAPNASAPEPVLMTKPGRMLPVLGEVVGGEDGEYIFNGSVMDYVACPPSLVNVPGAYVVYVDGESMYPRYRPGESVYVHPNKPARRGDDVVVQIRPSEEGMPPHGYVKEMVGWQGSKLVLAQYNPERRIEFDRSDVVSVHPIVLSGKYA